MHKNCTACDSQKTKKMLHFRGLFVNKCKNCGLFFVEEEFKTKESPGLYLDDMYTNYWNYESGFYSKHWNEFENHEKDILNDLENEAEHISKNYNQGKLLDVGCFKGHFCNFMWQKGWKTTGVDISKEAIDFGKKKFGLNLNLLCGEIDNLKLDKESFDIATMWGVIEHFPNPQTQIKQIYPLLKKGGVLIIKTQNQKSLLTLIAIVLYKLSFGIFNSHLDFFYSREHLCRFSPKSLNRLLESEGFSIKKISYDSAYIFKFTINKAKVHMKMVFKILEFFSRHTGKQDKIIVFAEKNMKK